MYRVTFNYVIDIEDADNEDKAREMALMEFIDNGDYQYADIQIEEIVE